MTITNNSIILESLDEESEARTQVDFENNLENEIVIAANSKYLLDFLSTSSNQTIVLGINDPNLPFYLEDGNFGTIIMPIVI